MDARGPDPGDPRPAQSGRERDRRRAAGDHPSCPPAIPTASSPLYLPAKPNNYLIWSILLTVFCGSIPGLIGIALGITCNQRYAEGDYKGAELASSMAKNCLIVSVVFSLILLGVLTMMMASFGSALYSLTDMLENS